MRKQKDAHGPNGPWAVSYHVSKGPQKRKILIEQDQVNVVDVIFLIPDVLLHDPVQLVVFAERHAGAI